MNNVSAMPDIEKTFTDFLNLSAACLGDGYMHIDLPLAYVTEEEEEEFSLESLAADIRVCKACPLCETRTLAVPGEGVFDPLVMVIGEGPGADEDRAGRPFVGRAGQLLDKMLDSIGLSRDKNCFIANMVKCRPPGNRNPSPDEIGACFPYLQKQIALLQPKIILCAGKISTQSLLNTSIGISALRGKIAAYNTGADGETIPLLPTFHPSAVLRDESLKRPVWEDLKLLRSELESAGHNPGE